MVININEKVSVMDSKLSQLIETVQKSATIQSNTITDVDNIQCILADLVVALGSLNTSIDRIFTKLERTLETADKITSMNLNVAISNAVNHKLASNNTVTVSTALTQLLDVLAQNNKLDSAKDFLAIMQQQLKEEVATNQLEAQQEKNQQERERKEELEERQKIEQLSLEARRK